MEQFVKVGRSKSSIVSVNLNRETSEGVYEEEIVFEISSLLSSVDNLWFSISSYLFKILTVTGR